MVHKKIKNIIVNRLALSLGLAVIGMFVAGPAISFLVKNTDAYVASGDIAAGFKMRIWVAFAFFLFPWIIEFNLWWFQYKSKGFQRFSLIILFVFSISYAIIRLIFAVQFYDFWKIDGVIQYINLRYFNLGRHLIVGAILGFFFSMASGIFKRYSTSKKSS